MWLVVCRLRARQIGLTKSVRYIQGKFVQTRNGDPNTRAEASLQMVHTDLAGPVATESIDGYKYVQSSTEDYSNATFVYFLKTRVISCRPQKSSKQIQPPMER